MSAICGIYELSSAPVRTGKLNGMLKDLDAHGPDGKGTWHDASVALGQQLMHITPESTGETLPLHHAESGVTLVADARLDNRDELLRAISSSSLHGQPDSALILAAYLKWGIAFVDRLIGEYSIAIWDAGKRQLHCVTDPMGIRPLFYFSSTNQCFAFASEIRPLLRVVPEPAINERRIALMGVSALTGYLETTQTCFRDISRVPAATVLTVSPSGISSREYWRPDAGKRLQFKSDEECAEAFREILFESHKTRLRSIPPVGALLSGGLDSSAIVGISSKLLDETNESLVTLSSLPEPDSRGMVTDEEAFIELFRDYPGLQINHVRAPGHGPFDDAEELVQTGALNAYGFQHYMYSALVRAGRKKGTRLLLDGYGGEFSASAHIPGFFPELLLHGRLSRLINELKTSSADGRIHVSSLKKQVIRPLVPFRLLKAAGRQEQFENLAAYPVREEFLRDVLGEEVNQVRDQILELLIIAPDHRTNMAQSIRRAQQDLRLRSHAGFRGYEEVRFSYPLLDKRVLEFGLAVDGRFKLENGEDRRLIRMASEGLVPDEIRNRTSKAAFCPDYHLRYLRQLDSASEALRELSLDQGLAGIVDFEKILSAMKNRPTHDPEKPMAVDYNSQFLVPYAWFLCYFLRNFKG